MTQLLIKYIYQLTKISCLLLCCFVFIQINLRSTEVKGNLATKLLESKIATFVKKPVSLDSLLTDSCNIIVFYHDYACKDCFKKIAAEVKQMEKENTGINLIVLVRAPLFNKYRRDMYKEAKKLLKTENIYFDIHSKKDKWPPSNLEEGLFSMFPIVQTPAILYITNSKSKIEFKSYAELFGNKGSKKSILKLP